MISPEIFPLIVFPCNDTAPLQLGPFGIHPAVLQVGCFEIRWYALAYVAGLLLGWRYLMALTSLPGSGMSRRDADDFLLWATIGVIIGGRLGYVAFYYPSHYFNHPIEILMPWLGGMSFHGGLIGVIASIILFSRARGIHPLSVSDLVACVAPIGLFFGRLANFINGELYGRASEVAWAIVFPAGGVAPRHPSQLYEAFLEGPVLLLILWGMSHVIPLANRRGLLAGIFLSGYASSRLICEMFREPDAHIGYFFGVVTLGQILSVPILIMGCILIILANRNTENTP